MMKYTFIWAPVDRGCVLAAGSVPPCGLVLRVIPSVCPPFPVHSSAVLWKMKAQIPKNYLKNENERSTVLSTCFYAHEISYVMLYCMWYAVYSHWYTSGCLWLVLLLLEQQRGIKWHPVQVSVPGFTSSSCSPLHMLSSVCATDLHVAPRLHIELM